MFIIGKFKKGIKATEQYRNGLERHGNGKSELEGKIRVFWEHWGWGQGQRVSPWDPQRDGLACMPHLQL